MIALDSSALIAFLAGATGRDTDLGLVTRDADLRQFVRAGGLRLVGGPHRVA